MAVKKIHELTNEALTANDDDFFVIDVDNGDGSFSTKKIKKSNIPTGTNSAPLIKTGQTVSFATGDDGDVQAGRDIDLFTLDFANHFGNNKRFTGVTGGYYDRATSQYKDVNGTVTTRAGAYPNDVVCDWSTFNSATDEFLMYRFSFNTSPWTQITSIDIPLINTGNFAGFNDWRLPNWNEVDNILIKKENLDFLQYEEVGNISGFFILWTSTSFSSGNVRYINNNGSAGIIASSATGLWFNIVRTANISEL